MLVAEGIKSSFSLSVVTPERNCLDMEYLKSHRHACSMIVD